MATDVEAFPEDAIQAVWERGRALPDQDPLRWRQDQCGAWIQRDHYANTASEFGWKIERVALGDAANLTNFQPFHVANSYAIATGEAHCRSTADRRHQAPSGHIVEPRNREA
jgi:hypothetical protein